MSTRHILAISVLFLIAIISPAVGFALEYQSDFDDFENNWLLEAGSEVDIDASSIVLRASDPSERDRGRILLRPILETTPGEIANLTFIVDTLEVSAPFAARAFYYDENRNYLGSDPLFGTLSAGQTVALGSVLSPSEAVRGLRIRFYANAPTGSVTLDRLTITTAAPPVPEPTTALLMGLGLAGLAGTRREPRRLS